ncbi:hypothetical protein [Sinorhizobium americanum]|uniref:hypothetical protein n=1 Tax=Sinorhizobium americanum TaxID=194963 RepID=UPI0007D9615C|nr:hypothetical protein [Sinorhizobium americanum]OAP38038.1 hypothetical protein ATC00_06905 [Sinorhizobium americanum]
MKNDAAAPSARPGRTERQTKNECGFRGNSPSQIVRIIHNVDCEGNATQVPFNGAALLRNHLLDAQDIAAGR